jgi:hypothetical protein
MADAVVVDASVVAPKENENAIILDVVLTYHS